MTLISAALLGFGAASCDDYLDVNKNVDAPDYVEGYLYLAGIQQSFYNVYGDALHVGSLAQMFGTGSSFYGHYYSVGSDTNGGMWRMTYWEQGMNLENMINQSIANEDWHLAGIGLIMKAISWDFSTKHNGEMPLDDAFVPGLLSHDYDYQEYVYMKIREWAKQGIAYLEMEDNSPLRPQIAGNDWIYSGDIEKWKKFGYAIIVRNLASLTQKDDFATKYYPELIEAASKAFTSVEDDATVKVAGGGAEASSSSYNNYWGVYRGNLTSDFHQYQYAVDVMQGMVRKVDEENNSYIEVDSVARMDTTSLYRKDLFKYELEAKQIICDTAVFTPGHWDPRRVAKLETVDGNHVGNFSEIDSIKSFIYHGGTYEKVAYFMSSSDYYGATTARNGQGRWLYRNDAPYILTTYAEMMFNVAEAHWTVGKKGDAFEAWKKAVAADMEFTAKYLVAGSTNVQNEKLSTGKYGDVTFHIGDKITAAQFNTAAAEYLAGPFVGGLSMDEFSLSHIMMQKFVALYPWGAHEAWVDQRKYHYDINYDKAAASNGVPTNGNGWNNDNVFQKYESNPDKVYKGYYLPASELRGSSFNEKNSGSPCYRIRPRYNSEYMWNKPSLKVLKPISGNADDYQCSVPWFAYPGDQPGAPTYDEVAE